MRLGAGLPRGARLTAVWVQSGDLRDARSEGHNPAACVRGRRAEGRPREDGFAGALSDRRPARHKGRAGHPQSDQLVGPSRQLYRDSGSFYNSLLCCCFLLSWRPLNRHVSCQEHSRPILRGTYTQQKAVTNRREPENHNRPIWLWW